MGIDNAFVFEFREMTEVDEKAQLKVAGPKIIEDLRAVPFGEVLDGFEFDNDFSEADKVREVFLDQRSPAIFHFQAGLRDGWDALVVELDAQTLLVDGFVAPTTSISVDFKTRTDDFEALFTIDEFSHDSVRAFSRSLVCFAFKIFALKL
jgi:hypothetical protein